MFIFKKEKRVIELVLQHIDKTGECLEVMCTAIKRYLSDIDQDMCTTANQVNILENEADNFLRDIRELLYSGAYLPTIRGDVYRLMSAVDDVANKAEDCSDFVFYQKPQIAEEYHSEFIAIIELTQGCFMEFRKALRNFFKQNDKEGKLREHMKKVSELESLIDDNERVLIAHIFESSLPLSDKLHLRQLLHRITCISDYIEDASDELQLVSLKSII
jgi:hypothetical protein